MHDHLFLSLFQKFRAIKSIVFNFISIILNTANLLNLIINYYYFKFIQFIFLINILYFLMTIALFKIPKIIFINNKSFFLIIHLFDHSFHPLLNSLKIIISLIY